MRIGDTIDAGLNQYDPSPYLRASADATRSIGNSIAQGIGAVGGAIEDRREKKDTIKTSKELAKAMSVLYPESAGALMPVIEQLDNEEMPLSERAALGSQIGEFINLGVQKSRDNALLSLETQRLGLDSRRVGLAERQYADLPVIERQQSDAINAQAINEAISIMQPLQEMEAPLGGQIPDMSGSAKRIIDAIESGDGATALSGAKEYQAARIKQMEPLMGPPKLELKQLGGTDATGQPLTIDAFISPAGEVFDINRKPLNAPMDGQVLPPRDDVPAASGGERRVVPMPQIGIRPAATPRARTETQQKLDELSLAQAEIDAKQAANSKQAAITTAKSAVDLMDRLEKHPGFNSAVGFSLTPGFVSGTDRKGAEAIIDQLKGQAFLTTITQMKGMGALSDAEGAKIQQAAARLNPDQSEADFKQALTEYKTGVQAAIARAGEIVAKEAKEDAAKAEEEKRTSAAARLRALQGK